MIHPYDKRLLSLAEIRALQEQNNGDSILEHRAFDNSISKQCFEWLREEDNDVYIRPVCEAKLYKVKPKQVQEILMTNRQSIVPAAYNYRQKKACKPWQGLSVLNLFCSLFSTTHTDRRTYRRTDTQTGRHTDRQAGRQIDRQTTDKRTESCRQAGRQTDSQSASQPASQTDRQTDWQTDRLTGRQTDRQTNTHIHSHFTLSM